MIKLIKFYTTWCGPCKMQTIVLNEVDLKGIELIEVDAEKNEDMKNKYKISSVPVLIFEKDNEIIDRINGFAPAELIQDKINSLI